ncbi:Fcf2-domain-containing protein [Piedraia hortae CBS 480.64]|uniref:Fcf2-domain-containing protein n=1 Tax=Piedraia hortae CBS 480.64 TaxID=1314780 RepID=A0A6A7C5F5_9PEZI|nr:Fcf2-domain-containing protein [Piedraia hortae CBS 480.64]
MALAAPTNGLSDEEIRQIFQDVQRSGWLPKLETKSLPKPYISFGKGGVSKLDRRRMHQERTAPQMRQMERVKVEDPIVVKKRAAQEKEATAGPDWHNMPRTVDTPQLKRDWQLIKMRDVLDPKRHYKKDGKKDLPEYSQVGTVIEGPADFFSGRIETKKRKRTFVEEVLAGEHETGRFKRKYNELQQKKSSGKKAYYKALKAKRSGGIRK